MSAPRVAAARALLIQRHPGALPEAGRTRTAVPTGIAALDRALPGGGFQRGRLAVWEPGIGAAALLRAACAHTVAQGERAAWVDASHRVAGACWRPGPLLVRPALATTPAEALRTAELLAGSGGFALVVLDGVEPDATPMVRLARAAHQGGAALVVLTRVTALASLRVASRSLLREYGWRRGRDGATDDVRTVKVEVEARTSGWRARTELVIPVWHDDLRLSPGLRGPDRRGAAR